MRRGDLVTVAGGGDYAGKPRPAVIVQSDDFGGSQGVTLCLLTGEEVDAPLLRVGIDPTPANGLRQPSWIMVEKISTVPRRKLGPVFGRLADTDMARLNRSLAVFLGLAG